MKEGVPKQREEMLKPVMDVHGAQDFFKFGEINGHPDQIIRKETFNTLEERYGGKLKVPELVQMARELYNELETKFGISIPADFCIGKDDHGFDVVFSIVDKIRGDDLTRLKWSEGVPDQIETLYASLARYFMEKRETGGLYLWDINHPSQYVYGRKSDDQREKIYLIDTDIFINNSIVGLYLTVEWLTRHMRGLSRQFAYTGEGHPEMKFDQAKEYIEQFMDQPIPDKITEQEKENVQKNIDGINKFLRDEKLGPAPKTAIPVFV